MDWTLSHTASGQTKTFWAWGFSEPVIELVSFDVSTCRFDHQGARYDSAPLFAFRDEIVIKADETVVFRGQVRKTPSGVVGSAEQFRYEIADCIWNLTRLPFMQSWGSDTGHLARVILFAAQNGASIDANAVFQEVIDYANECGLPVQFGSAEGITIRPVALDAREAKCMEVLTSVRAWCPDVATVLDYSTSPTTIHFVKRADATVKTLPALRSGHTVNIDPLYEMQVSQVVVCYETHNVVDGVDMIVPSIDAYPPGSDGRAEGAVVLSVQVGGITRQSQNLVTRNISPEAKWWWKAHAGWLQEVSGAGFVIDNGTITVPVNSSSGDGVPDGPNTFGWINEVLDGAIPASASSDASGRVRVRAKAKNFFWKGEFYTEKELETSVEATSLGGGTYFDDDFSAVEAIPLGVAQAYYEATNPLHWQGAYVLTEKEIDLTLPRPGDKLNLTGGESEARGWTTMDAHVQAVTINIAAGTTSINVGPPAHLGLADMIAVGRPRQGKSESQQRLSRAGQGSAGKISGPKKTANASPAATPEPPNKGLNLLVYEVSEGVFSCTSGLVNSPRVKVNGTGGADINNASPPTWELTDGVIYMAFIWTPGYTRNTLSSITGPVCYVAAAASTPADDEGAGHFYRVLATIVDGHITNNFSPRKNLVAKLEDKGEGNSKVVATIG